MRACNLSLLDNVNCLSIRQFSYPKEILKCLPFISVDNEPIFGFAVHI